VSVPKFYSPAELSELLSVSESWLLDNLPSHRWNHVRRFREDEVLKRLAELEGREDNVVKLREAL
jgi:hypothetical protein